MSEYEDDADENMGETLDDGIEDFLDAMEEDDQIVLTEDEALRKADGMCNPNQLYAFYVEEMNK